MEKQALVRPDDRGRGGGPESEPSTRGTRQPVSGLKVGHRVKWLADPGTSKGSDVSLQQDRGAH